PLFLHWLDPTEIADRFGARRAAYERVRRWFAAQGFEVVHDSPSRISFEVAGTAGQVARALGAPIRLIRHHGREQRAPAVEPVLPESIAADVRGITGLDDLPQ